ncbi:MAG: hypothetical protein M1835_000898 [Candelina submexicana]|nr:MAG: hypothetical protein M1835_000898 [Candelina submexicana]
MSGQPSSGSAPSGPRSTSNGPSTGAISMPQQQNNGGPGGATAGGQSGAPTQQNLNSIKFCIRAYVSMIAICATNGERPS